MAREARPIDDQIEEYLRHCQHTRRQSNMTINGKRHTYKHLVLATKVKDIREFTNKHYDLWLEYMYKRKVSARTINTRMSYIIKLVKYFKEMYDWEIPIKLPMLKKLKEGKARRVAYSREQINKVLGLADEMTRLLVKICFDAGLRISELRNLRLDNFTDCRINFIGKGSKDRGSSITAETKEELDEWIRGQGVTSYLWMNERGKQYSVDQLRIRMKEAFHKAGFYDFYPHALRHSFGTDLQRRGASLMEMQMMLGHSNAETTQRYLHGLDGKLGNLFEKYHNEEQEPNQAAPTSNYSAVAGASGDMQHVLVELLREVRELRLERTK